MNTMMPTYLFLDAVNAMATMAVMAKRTVRNRSTLLSTHWISPAAAMRKTAPIRATRAPRTQLKVERDLDPVTMDPSPPTMATPPATSVRSLHVSLAKKSSNEIAAIAISSNFASMTAIMKMTAAIISMMPNALVQPFIPR